MQGVSKSEKLLIIHNTWITGTGIAFVSAWLDVSYGGGGRFNYPVRVLGHLFNCSRVQAWELPPGGFMKFIAG